jgi:hypothetical protein
MTYQDVLFSYRSALIAWVTWAVLPFEMAFDAVETEIARCANV